MAPARKQKHSKTFKSANHGEYVHPSLSGSQGSGAQARAATGLGIPSSMTHPGNSGLSVNERIEFLRRTQTPRLRPEQINELWASRFANASGTGIRTSRIPAPTGVRRRLAGPGPAPPPSWVVEGPDFLQKDEEKIIASQQKGGSKAKGAKVRRRPPEVLPFSFDYTARTLMSFVPPAEETAANGMPHFTASRQAPLPGSLIDYTLRVMARDFAFHIDFDHVYLSCLPTQLRLWLLSYVARYGSLEDGMGLKGLRCLFSNNSESGLYEGPDDQSDVTKLDLSGSMGHILSFKDLERIWYLPHRNPPSSSSLPPSPPAEETRLMEKLHISKPSSRGGAEDIPESWDGSDALDRMPEATSHSIPASISPARFASLTHLSLAYSSFSVSWPSFLSFTRASSSQPPALSTVTHLSLAGWPHPALSSSSARLLPEGDADPTVAEDEAVYILRTLARNTPALQVLDLSDCHDWFDVLRYVPRRQPETCGRVLPPRSRSLRPVFEADPSPHSAEPSRKADDGGVEWCRAWKRVHSVIARQTPASYAVGGGGGRAAATATAITARERPMPPRGVDLEVLATLLKNRGKVGVVARPGADVDERYRIVTQDPLVKEGLEETRVRKDWVRRECAATALDAFLRQKRREGGMAGGSIAVEYGWDRETLVARGYPEAEVFAAGI